MDAVKYHVDWAVRVKKTCQALRDCNRQDRQGYALGVAVPTDVVKAAESLASTGLSTRERAAQAAAVSAAKAAAESTATLKRARGDADFYTPLTSMTLVSSSSLSQQVGGAIGCPSPAGTATTAAETTPGRSISPSVENAAEWLKRQKTDDASNSDAAAGQAKSACASSVVQASTTTSAPGTTSTATPLFAQPSQVHVEIVGTPRSVPPPTVHRTTVAAPAPITAIDAPANPNNSGWTNITTTTHRQPLSDSESAAFPPIDFAPAPTTTANGGGPTIASAPSPPSLEGCSGGAALALAPAAQQQHHHTCQHNDGGSTATPVPLLPAAPTPPHSALPNHHHHPHHHQQQQYNHSSYHNGAAAGTTSTTTMMGPSPSYHYSHHNNPSLFQHHHVPLAVEPMPLHATNAASYHMETLAGPSPAGIEHPHHQYPHHHSHHHHHVATETSQLNIGEL